MADLDAIRSIGGPKLADLQQHVTDVLALSLVAEDEFQVGKLTMAAYDFVPYALTGLSAAMQTPPAEVNRALTHVTLPISDDRGGEASAERDVTLFGPGDVLGVDDGQIVRRYPPPGSTNAEETFHAHIEFDRPELPWAFSAHAAGERMPAWLALVVFERDEVEWEPAATGLQPVAAVEAAVLPPLASAWAWAHAQATAGSASLSARLSTAHAPVNVSRLLAARVLTQNTNYVACLVPTTDVGRRAGLGLSGGTRAAAWSPNDGIVRLPVYDRWEFRTAPDGDFARLARRLVGVAAPWEIGRRTMDTSRPGEPLTDLTPNEAGRRQVIKCALYSPAPQPAGIVADDARWNSTRTAALKAAIERPAVIEGTAGTDPGELPDLPIVGPRVYAKGQRGRSTVPAGDWFADINLAPVHRVVAGLGTRVVVRDQEPLMQAAWAQVGEIDRANRELALAELARHLAASVHARLASVDLGRLLQMTRPLAPRVRLEGAALTLAGQTVRSATPTTALGGSFRRAVRATGPLGRRLAVDERAMFTGIVASGRTARDFTRPYSVPDGIGGLSAQAIETLDADAVSKAINVQPATALTVLKGAAETLSAKLTLATAVTTPSAWKAADTSFQPGVAATARIVDRLKTRLPLDAGTESVRARWIGGLAAGLAASQVEGTATLREVALSLETAMTAVATRAGSFEAAPVVRPAPSGRAVSAAMLRAGAGAGAGASVSRPSGLSTRASGSLAGSMVRPVAVAEAQHAAAAITERVRLDRFITPQGALLATWAERAGRVTILDVRAQVSTLVDAPGVLELAPTPPRNALAVRREEILARLDPDRTVIDQLLGRLQLGNVAFEVIADQIIRPIMAAPRFDRPMYKALDSYNREWLVPGLNALKQPELVTLLSSNDEFTEAFLVGLSDEMGRELLWRNYPTDQRGTYFHRFWDPAEDELRQPIHRFSPSRLGSHVTGGPIDQSGRAVVVLRGELVRRYPDLTVMAMRETGRDPDDKRRPLLPEAPKGMPDAAPSLFHAMLPPDVMLAGLDITVDVLRQPGWWIVLAEHPQATRFRRRAEPDLNGHEVRFTVAPKARDTTGATVANDRLENPTRIAFEAGDFLPSTR